MRFASRVTDVVIDGGAMRAVVLADGVQNLLAGRILEHVAGGAGDEHVSNDVLVFLRGERHDAEFVALADKYADQGALYHPTAKLREMAKNGQSFFG